MKKPVSSKIPVFMALSISFGLLIGVLMNNIPMLLSGSSGIGLLAGLWADRVDRDKKK